MKLRQKFSSARMLRSVLCAAADNGATGVAAAAHIDIERALLDAYDESDEDDEEGAAAAESDSDDDGDGADEDSSVEPDQEGSTSEDDDERVLEHGGSSAQGAGRGMLCDDSDASEEGEEGMEASGSDGALEEGPQEMEVDGDPYGCVHALLLDRKRACALFCIVPSFVFQIERERGFVCSRRLRAHSVFLVVARCLGPCLCAPVLASLVRARGLGFRLGVCLLGFPAVVCAVTPFPTISSLCKKNQHTTLTSHALCAIETPDRDIGARHPRLARQGAT